MVRGKKSRLRDDGKDWLTVASSNRSAHLRMIDDRFENVIKDYEDELLGQLNSDEEGDALHGELDINAFADQMDEFLADLAPKKVPITEVDSLVREKVRKKAKTQDEAEDANFVDPALLVQDVRVSNSLDMNACAHVFEFFFSYCSFDVVGKRVDCFLKKVLVGMCT